MAKILFITNVIELDDISYLDLWNPLFLISHSKKKRKIKGSAN